jgi:hypothetical protein
MAGIVLMLFVVTNGEAVSRSRKTKWPFWTSASA